MNQQHPRHLVVLLSVLVLLASKGTAAQDLTNDSMLNLQDAQAFLQTIAHGATPGPGLDLNGDGTIDLSDALLYGQWINGLWHNDTCGYPALYFSNQADTAAYGAYRTNLSRRSSWNASDLSQRYPDHTAKSALGYSKDQVGYVDSLITMLSHEDQAHGRDTAYLNGFVRGVLQNGMAVYSAKAYPSMYAAMDAIHSNDLPLLFTTDALLQTIYLSYDNILMQLETNHFAGMLENILKVSLAYCSRTYGSADYEQFVKDYLSCALFLLNPGRTDIVKSAKVTSYLGAIAGGSMTTIGFLDTMVLVDFSQFKPRGHYTKTTLLSNYFKAMMFLSRADLSLIIGGKDARSKMKKAGLVLWGCVVNSGSYPQWLSFNDVIEFMVGASDGLSIKGMSGLVHDLGSPAIPAYLKAFNESAFDSVSSRNRHGYQLILSQGIAYDPHKYDSLGLSQIFSFLPQRFVIDSYTFSQMVFPLVYYRPLPSSMDISFVLGDNAALKYHPDLSVPALPGILGSQRQLYDDISPQGWQSNLYTSWMNFLRKLNGVEDNPRVSPCFRTTAWRDKMRNTQLTSWAHLRHNTILYAKQSYTGMIVCQHPAAYIEPYPEFFDAVARYASKGKLYFDKIDGQIAAYFANAASIAAWLKQIAELTAQGKPPTSEQYDWLRQIVTPKYVSVGCGSVKVFSGWYFDLIYDIDKPWQKAGQQTSYATIADVHTKPADEKGPAQVLHAATGYINLMAVVVEVDSCKSIYLGPVGSYYDVVTTSASPQRMTDEEWIGRLDSGTAGPRPVWTASFLYQ